MGQQRFAALASNLVRSGLATAQHRRRAGSGRLADVSRWPATRRPSASTIAKTRRSATPRCGRATSGRWCSPGRSISSRAARVSSAAFRSLSKAQATASVSGASSRRSSTCNGFTRRAACWTTTWRSTSRSPARTAPAKLDARFFGGENVAAEPSGQGIGPASFRLLGDRRDPQGRLEHDARQCLVPARHHGGSRRAGGHPDPGGRPADPAKDSATTPSSLRLSRRLELALEASSIGVWEHDLDDQHAGLGRPRQRNLRQACRREDCAAMTTGPGRSTRRPRAGACRFRPGCDHQGALSLGLSGCPPRRRGPLSARQRRVLPGRQRRDQDDRRGMGRDRRRPAEQGSGARPPTGGSENAELEAPRRASSTTRCTIR